MKNEVIYDEICRRTTAGAMASSRCGVAARFTGSPSPGQLWSEVEWSPRRRAWCIQDAAGHCLTHVEHIHAQDVDAQVAIRLAKRMIRDGRMPAPEDAQRQLVERLRRDRLGEPMEIIRERQQQNK